MGVMKMRNTLPRVGLEPTSLAFWASVLALHYIGYCSHVKGNTESNSKNLWCQSFVVLAKINLTCFLFKSLKS